MTLRSGPATWAFLAALGIAQTSYWWLFAPAHDGTTAFAWQALLLSALQWVVVIWLWHRGDRVCLWMVLAFAVASRLGAWTWPPVLSSDVHRYVWDGRVQMANINPYMAPPVDPRLAHLRDADVFPHINRPNSVTVYPPGGQFAFLALASVGGDSVRGVKTAALIAELGALLLVALALRRRDLLTAGRLALYAWSPLIIAEVCVSGHLDALVLPLVMGALLLAERRRAGWAGALLGAATALKLYPVLLLVALPRAGLKRAVVCLAAVVGVLYLPYTLVAGRSVLGFLPDYVGVAEDFNMSVRGFAQQMLAPLSDHARPIAMALCACALVGTLLWVYRGHEREGDGDAFLSARNVVMAFVLLLPTAVHPWYALWLVLLLAMHPHIAGIWIVALLPLSYLKYGASDGHMPAWVLWVEWVPALLALLVIRFAGRAATRWEIA